MLLHYTRKAGEIYNNIAVIKAIRAYNRMGLKECREAVEFVYEHGEVNIPDGDGDLHMMRRDLAALGSFAVNSSQDELYAGIEKCISLAVEVREYKTARNLINTLHSSLRDGTKEA